MKITETAVRHRITTTMVFLGLFVLGIISLSRLGLELFPDVTMPTVAVIAVYPGVGPYEVESGVTEHLEEAVASINGVEQVSSSASEGVTMVTVNFQWGTDMDTIVPEVREKLNEIEDDLPDGAERPMIFKYNPAILPTLQLNVFSNVEGIDVRRLVLDLIVPELEKIRGVATADVFGGEQRAVLCRLDLAAINKLSIPVTQILRAFQGENVNLPGGSIALEDRYMVLRTIGEFASLRDIEHVLVGYTDRVPVYLRDVAEVSLDALPQEEFVRAGGATGVLLSIRKQPGYNTVEINREVLARIDELEQSLPPSIRIQVQSDQSVSVVQSIGGVASAAWQGGLLAIVVLLLFLRNIRSTLIISVVIPVSVIATFSLMDFGGLTINITSLLGITLGVGMFVDNSIVVLESTYRKQLAGRDATAAAVEGTDEVGRAILASTFTTVAVFLPMVFVEGLAGLLFRDLAYTISYALGVSLFVALTIIPMLCARFLDVDVGSARVHAGVTNHDELSLADVEVHTGNPAIDRASGAIQRALHWMDNRYERVIQWALENTVFVVGSAVALLALSVGSILLLGMEFLPETDEARFGISMETMVGVPYEYTQRKVLLAESILQEVAGEDLVTFASSIGRGGDMGGVADTGSNLAMLNVSLVEKGQRDRSIWEVISILNRRMNSEILDTKFQFQVQGMASLATTATGETSPIVVELSGNDLDAMYDYAQTIAGLAETVPGLRDVSISHKTGKPELQLRIMRRRAVSLGLSPLEIAATIRTAYRGSEVSRYTEGEDYDVYVMLQEEDRNDLDRLRNLFFVNQAGTKIPLENVVQIEERTGPLSISRQNRTRVMKVTAALTGERALSDAVGDLQSLIAREAPTPLSMDMEFTGTSEEMMTSFTSLAYALALAAALVYMVMASQFESLLHPLIVMFSVPFAAIGLVGALLATGTTFNLVAFVGAILLVGIVVNNAIVLVDYMNTLRRRGVGLREAIIHGGKTRLKPILMTSLTTILGLLPMALGLGTGSELRAPMGRAVVGGLTTSTLITLILIPTLYWMVESKLEARRHAKAHA